MSAAETAETAKAAGNAAFKLGQFDAAIEHFTAAIEADPTNHVLYSNRSGAYAAKGSFTEALLDANKCIELKGDWPKGHSRRGAAYFGLKNWIQAQASYEKGLELDPSSAVMKDELEKVKLRRNPKAAAAAAAAAGTPSPSTGTVAKVLSLGAIVSGAFYAVPLLGAGRAFQAYRLSVILVREQLTLRPAGTSAIFSPVAHFAGGRTCAHRCSRCSWLTCGADFRRRWRRSATTNSRAVRRCRRLCCASSWCSRRRCRLRSCPSSPAPFSM